MSTRIQATGPSPNVASERTAARTTAPPARPFNEVMRASAGAIVSSAEQAVLRLPGGPILAAALRSPAPTVGTLESPIGPSSAAAPAELGGVGPAGGATAPSIEGVLSQNANQNLYFLQLQERISQENRAYTTVSNVLKARHETVKNAIGNIR